MANTVLKIKGMTCASCANGIEKSLSSMDGVKKANVNLAIERATVEYDENIVSLEAIVQRVQTMGYDIIFDRIELDIYGMTCASCANRIEKVLNRTPGINKATVNLALERATIEYSGLDLEVKDLIKQVEKTGYKATEHRTENVDAEKEARDKEISNLKRRFIISAILSVPLLASMLMYFNITLPTLIHNPYFQWALATPIQFYVGYEFYKGAYTAIRNRSANMDVLVVMGTSAAYLYSIWETLIGGMYVYFETSGLIITLVLLGKLLEAIAKGRTSEAIKKLMDLEAKTAYVIRDGKELEISIKEVLVNDIIIVRPGQKIPVDGEIIEGTSAIDESMITGESIPIDKKEGDQVFGATINKYGAFKFRATKVGKDTVLAQIIKVVEDAQGAKAPIQKLADRVSGVFVPIVIGIAIVTFFVWYLLINVNFAFALSASIAVLVIACPCALGLATPTSIMVGTGKGAEKGILFKSGEHLQNLQSVNTVILDKTGTITKGQPELVDIYTMDDISTVELLKLAASAEQPSEHPLGQAIVKGTKAKGIQLFEATAFNAIPGFGIEAEVDNKKLQVGTRKLMQENSINYEKVENRLEQLEDEGKTVMLVAINQQISGLIAVADTVKEDSKEAILRLKELGLKIVMITGDNKKTAEAIAKEVGIDEVRAEVLPEDKAKEVQRLKDSGQIVAMVGDGINDAPALVTADVGIAIGTGADVAIESSDITLMRGNLKGLVNAVILSRKTMRNIKQNLFWAFIYNSIGIPVAALGLLEPWIAATAMAFSSVSVVTNSLRLKRVKLED